MEEKGAALFNVFPLRSEIVPKHFTVDSTTLIKLLYEKNNEYSEPASSFLLYGALDGRADEIWAMFFKTERKEFHNVKNDDGFFSDEHRYHFRHIIKTDGVACCIILSTYDDDNKKRRRGEKEPAKREEKYIDSLTANDRDRIQEKKIVAIDPNMRDLLFCVDSDRPKRKPANSNEVDDRDEEGELLFQTQFRYTKDQRRTETKQKKYAEIRAKLKVEHPNIAGKSPQTWEDELSTHNKRTVCFERFKEYVSKKNIVNKHLGDLYGQRLFRKLRLGSYIRVQISEGKIPRKKD